MPILTQLLINLNGIERIYNENIEVYVDELQGYDDVINELEQICINGGLVKNISKIDLCKSSSETLIQAADLLCGYITRILRDVDAIDLDKKDIEIWDGLCGLHDGLAKEHIVIWEYDAHNDFLRMIAKLMGLDIYPKDDFLSVIKRYFGLAMQR